VSAAAVALGWMNPQDAQNACLHAPAVMSPAVTNYL